MGVTCERRWVRIRKRLKVTFGQSASFTVNVSAGGFCAQLLRVMPAGTRVEGTILVNGKALPYAGRVAWSKPGEARLAIPGRMGVEYTSVDSALSRTMGEAHEAGAIVELSGRTVLDGGG